MSLEICTLDYLLEPGLHLSSVQPFPIVVVEIGRWKIRTWCNFHSECAKAFANSVLMLALRLRSGGFSIIQKAYIVSYQGIRTNSFGNDPHG